MIYIFFVLFTLIILAIITFIIAYYVFFYRNNELWTKHGDAGLYRMLASCPSFSRLNEKEIAISSASGVVTIEKSKFLFLTYYYIPGIFIPTFSMSSKFIKNLFKKLPWKDMMEREVFIFGEQVKNMKNE